LTQHFNPWLICFWMWILVLGLRLPVFVNNFIDCFDDQNKVCAYLSPYSDAKLYSRLKEERDNFECRVTERTLLCAYAGIYTAGVNLVLLSNLVVWLKLKHMRKKTQANGEGDVNLHGFSRLSTTLILISFTGAIFNIPMLAIYWKNCLNPAFMPRIFIFSWGVRNLYLWNYVVNFMVYFLREGIKKCDICHLKSAPPPFFERMTRKCFPSFSSFLHVPGGKFGPFLFQMIFFCQNME